MRSILDTTERRMIRYDTARAILATTERRTIRPNAGTRWTNDTIRYDTARTNDTTDTNTHNLCRDTTRPTPLPNTAKCPPSLYSLICCYSLALFAVRYWEADLSAVLLWFYKQGLKTESITHNWYCTIASCLLFFHQFFTLSYDEVGVGEEEDRCKLL